MENIKKLNIQKDDSKKEEKSKEQEYKMPRSTVDMLEQTLQIA